ncbi:hypothetical protein I3843_16G061400 [Carya illinoinensis]|nr:hypothetical protein I3843_16G061400 [Carya illinoinensis]
MENVGPAAHTCRKLGSIITHGWKGNKSTNTAGQLTRHTTIETQTEMLRDSAEEQQALFLLLVLQQHMD